MYYSGSNNKRHYKILSAVSKDGIHWRKERGTRINSLSSGFLESICDPFVLHFQEIWRMYFSGIQQGSERIYSASSTDGLAWKLENGIRLDIGKSGMERHVNNCCIVQLNQELFRMYFRGADRNPLQNCIYSAISQNGIDWNIETGFRLDFNGPYEGHGVECPYVFKLSQHRFRMYYTGYFGKNLFNKFIPYTYRHLS
jgi:predicted GH43/DUF377 family glycosyl hydrolase